MNTLETTGLALGYKGRSVLHDLRLAVRPGSVLALAGPNGAGKTTLLRALARLLRPTRGAVLLDGRDVWALSERETARRLGLVPQGETSEWPLTVEQVVTLGPRRIAAGSCPTPRPITPRWTLRSRRPA